jgi:hypothetical protein
MPSTRQPSKPDLPELPVRLYKQKYYILTYNKSLPQTTQHTWITSKRWSLCKHSMQQRVAHRWANSKVNPP